MPEERTPLPFLPLQAGRTRDLFQVFYKELRAIAASQARGQPRDQTLNVTALVNELFLKMNARQEGWVSDEHFLRTASRAVRQIIVDYARTRKASKRGASFERVSFSGVENEAATDEIDAIEFDSVLDQLERKDPYLAQIIELRYFCGMTVEETARMLGVSISTLKRDWNYARAWLFSKLKPAE